MKVAISGAGVAGAALAHWLQRTGHTPTVIERAPKFRTGGYMIDFWGVGYQVAKRMGITDQIAAAGYHMEHVRSVGPTGKVKADLGVDVFRRMVGDDFTSLPRGDLAAAIYTTIEDQVETTFDDSIATIDEHRDGVRLTFERTAPRDFDLVIGRREHACAGGQTVIDDNDRLAGDIGGRALAAVGGLAPKQFPTLTFGDVAQLLRCDPQAPHDVVIDHDAAAAGQCTNGELVMPRGTKFAHDEGV